MQLFHRSISQNPIAISSTFRIWTCWFFGYSSERLHCSKHTDAKKHHRAWTNNSTTTLTHTERPNLDTKNDRNKNAENHRKTRKPMRREGQKGYQNRPTWFPITCIMHCMQSLHHAFACSVLQSCHPFAAAQNSPADGRWWCHLGGSCGSLKSFWTLLQAIHIIHIMYISNHISLTRPLHTQ